MSTMEVKVPDIGDFKEVEVIEVLVNAGESIAVEQSLITVESDKASMEIPAATAGVLKELRVKVGDKVSEGTVLGVVEVEDDAGQTAPAAPQPAVREQASPQQPSANAGHAPASDGQRGESQGTLELKVPDIGDFKEVEVIEVLVSPGDTIAAEQSLITVESDKASMEIPSPAAGVLKALSVKVGDKVSEGSVLGIVEARSGGGASTAPSGKGSGQQQAGQQSGAQQPAPAQTGVRQAEPQQADSQAAGVRPLSDSDEGRAEPETIIGGGRGRTPSELAAPASPAELGQAGAQAGESHVVKPHASPSVRKFARELGVDLSQLSGSGPKQRITHDDVRNWVKRAIARTESAPQSVGRAPQGDQGAAHGLIAWPKVDFAKFGPIETKPVARIRKIAAANLHRNWVMIPHVTNHDEADITELEAFRVRLNEEQGKGGAKVTMLAFLIKACVATLQKFPEFNASLEGENLVYKRYWHIGFAADTPNGLMVPVIRDADTKGIVQIARETAELAGKAREGKLSPAEMQGGTFSISSLGGIGGTAFTPIINAPEVAILGVCRSYMKPVWNGEKFKPRLILPLSLSWDHRVVDGAAAARFNVHLAQLLADFRRVML
jgi:pyruvate dehydrogenase E2 component (dihydrolipoamide acetyltransferase)